MEEAPSEGAGLATPRLAYCRRVDVAWVCLVYRLGDYEVNIHDHFTLCRLQLPPMSDGKGWGPAAATAAEETIVRPPHCCCRPRCWWWCRLPCLV